MALPGRVLREGVVGGLIGATVVALWFLVFDVVQGAPLRTPTVLGRVIAGIALGRGMPDPYAGIALAPIAGYTVLHGLGFVVIGLIAAFLIDGAEREPAMLLGLLILFLCFELIFLGIVSAVDEALVDALLWWNIAIGNLLAAVAMITYFFLGHRSLGARLLERWSED